MCVETLKEYNIHVVHGETDKEGEYASSYGSEAFRRKTHLKTSMVLKALRMGYNVLLVDVDIVFLKNPFPYFTCEKCDIHIQTDGPEINAGFYFVRPTDASIILHERALKLGLQSTQMTSQKALAAVMETMIGSELLQVEILNVQQFPPGMVYFEEGQRMFYMDNTCSECVIIHNNWIVTAAAKRYRFREHLMWQVDQDGYYTDRQATYLYYENPVDFGAKYTLYQEIDALKTALSIGYILNRTVIVPDFHCYPDSEYNQIDIQLISNRCLEQRHDHIDPGHTCSFSDFECSTATCHKQANRCSLNTHIHIETFDKYFDKAYREHVFMMHPKVPAGIHLSQSEIILIESSVSQMYENTKSFQQNLHERLLTPADISGGVSVQEIQRWFKPYEQTSLLILHSLYSVFKGFPDEPQFDDIRKKLHHGIIPSNYRQYDNPPNSPHKNKKTLSNRGVGY